MLTTRFCSHPIFGAASAAILLLMTSCSTVLESRTDTSEPGLKYFLPKTLVTIEIVPLGYAATAKVAELSTSEREAAMAAGSIRVQTKVSGRTYTVLVDSTGALLEPLVTGLQLRLPDPDKAELVVPDARAGLVLQYQSSPLSTDRVCIGVNENSLLQFAEAKVKDETGNIVVSIAKFAGRLAGPGAFVPTQSG